MNETFRNWFWDKFAEFSKPEGRQRAKSQAQFARSIGETPANVSRWLNGDATPERSTVIRLARVFGDEIYSVTGFDPPDASEWVNSKPLPDLIAIASLIDTWKAEISERGIAIDSPESEAIIRELARKEKS